MNNKDRMFFKKDLKEKKELVNIEIDRFLPRKDEYPKQIHKAMRYTLFAGGKRLRPYLLLNVYQLFNDDISKVLKVAAAIEILHTYTLIHDDLPDMDDDEIRRGKKTNHLLFGENIALLAGDALLVNAFELLAEIDYEDSVKMQLINELAVAAGSQGLIGGQIMDILSEGKKITPKTLDYIHKSKTGKLIAIAVRFACILAKAPEKDIKKMEKFAEKIGLAFQIVDDILDVEGSKSTLGKDTGKDNQLGKATYPAVFGLDESKEKAETLIEEAKEILAGYGEKAKALNILCDYIISRKK